MKISLILLIAVFTAMFSFAQDTIQGQVIRADTIREAVEVPATETALPPKETKKTGLKKDKVYYGGYANLSFGNYTVIGFEPMMGYKLTPKFSLGGKLTYEYIKDKRYSSTYETSNYGFSLFSRFRITQGFYAHAEYSAMNYNLFDSSGESERKWVPFLFLGGGISQPISRNTWFNAEVLFDVLQNKNSPYKDWEPFFSVGFGVGF